MMKYALCALFLTISFSCFSQQATLGKRCKADSVRIMLGKMACSNVAERIDWQDVTEGWMVYKDSSVGHVYKIETREILATMIWIHATNDATLRMKWDKKDIVVKSNISKF